MNISINKQSSIRIDNIFFDPYEIGKQDKVDYIFITHSHYDHFDIDSIKLIADNNTIFIVPMDENIYKKLYSYFGEDKVVIVESNKEYNINGLSFRTVYSYNIDKPFHKKSDAFLGYIVNVDNSICYIMGDTDITEENKKEKCDILFIPIGGTYTMDYKEASILTNIIKPKIVIPTHYGSIVGDKNDGKRFEELVDKNIDCQIKIIDN